MYRIFGSPYALSTHQCAAYLRHKQLPFTLHCTSLWVVRLAAWWHGANSTYCSLSPDGVTLPAFTDLVTHCEALHPRPALEMPTATHPRLRTVSWLLQLYSMWWLMNTGGMFRWVHGEGSDVINAHAGFFMVTSAAPLASGLGRTIREKMRLTLRSYGMCAETEPYVLQHFAALCGALDAHLEAHRYVLGTAGATLADVTLAAAFEGQFLMDDPPKAELTDGVTYPHLAAWCKRMATAPAAGVEVSQKDVMRFNDDVPESLEPVLELALEVLPWLVAQCEATQAWVDAAPPPELQVTAGAGAAVAAHRVPRILDQPWCMAVDGASIDCHVSVPHVALAHHAAVDVAGIDLDAPGRLASAARTDVLPRNAIEDIQLNLARCRLQGLTVTAVQDQGADFAYAIWKEVENEK
jgi:hypothetical protein